MWTDKTRPVIGQQYESTDGVVIEVRAIWAGGVVCRGRRTFLIDEFLELFM